MHVLFAEFDQRLNRLVHWDAGKPDIPDACGMRLNFNGLRRGKLVREPGRQGIGKTRANTQYRVSPFNRLFYRASAG